MKRVAKSLLEMTPGRQLRVGWFCLEAAQLSTSRSTDQFLQLLNRDRLAEPMQHTMTI